MHLECTAVLCRSSKARLGPWRAYNRWVRRRRRAHIRRPPTMVSRAPALAVHRHRRRRAGTSLRRPWPPTRSARPSCPRPLTLRNSAASPPRARARAPTRKDWLLPRNCCAVETPNTQEEVSRWWSAIWFGKRTVLLD